MISLLLIDGRPVRRQRFIKALEIAADIVVVGGISALEFYRETQERTPARIVVVDGAFSDAHYYATFLAEARALGSAVVPIWDYPTPDTERWQSELLAGRHGRKPLEPDPRLLLFIDTIRTAARSRPGQPAASSQHSEMSPFLSPHEASSQRSSTSNRASSTLSPPIDPPKRRILPCPIVGLGASTGGVQALAQVLAKWPVDCPPTLIVQHMPASYMQGFADRLDRLTPARVKVARDGDQLDCGMVYVAPGDNRHMRVKSHTHNMISLRQGEPISGHVPAVDALFASLAPLKSRARCAILTGMGADGAEGIVQVRKAGGRTVAQDEQSCVVFGMPKEAIERGGTDTVLPLDQIAQWLLQDTSHPRL